MAPLTVLGPLRLAGCAARAANRCIRGSPAATLVPFTAYGVVVVAGAQNPGSLPPQWLVSSAVAANSLQSWSGPQRWPPWLTPLGRPAGGGLVAGGVLLLWRCV